MIMVKKNYQSCLWDFIGGGYSFEIIRSFTAITAADVVRVRLCYCSFYRRCDRLVAFDSNIKYIFVLKKNDTTAEFFGEKSWLLSLFSCSCWHETAEIYFCIIFKSIFLRCNPNYNILVETFGVLRGLKHRKHYSEDVKSHRKFSAKYKRNFSCFFTFFGFYFSCLHKLFMFFFCNWA